MEWFQTINKIKGIAKSEIIVTSCWIREQIKNVITYCQIKHLYYLYEIEVDNKAVKTKDKAKTPIDLEKKITFKRM